MLFNSIPYLIFFPIVFTLFWLSPQRFRRILLLVASYLFYMSWIPAYGLLIAALTLVNYVFGLLIPSQQKYAKPIFCLGIIFNLGILCYYKYANFLVNSFFTAQHYLLALSNQPSAATANSFALNVILPLGISFYAFEFIHYLTDVYKGGRPLKNIIDFSLFSVFFPSQIAGPIKRYQQFEHQLEVIGKFQGKQFNRGLSLFLQGLFKKVALADNLSPIANAGFHNAAQLGCGEAWITALAFTLQIYFDFSGYTDMGRGSAFMLGIELPDNFNFPYIANSLQEFWKRWHISLSTWLRDYLYIPLGGNKMKTKFGIYRNLLITMLLGGLWHGAAWHFVIWGFIHGMGLIVNHFYADIVKKSQALADFHKNSIGIFCSWLITLLFVIFGWIFFRADSTSQAINMLNALVSSKHSTVLGEMLVSSTAGAALLVYSIYCLFFIAPKIFSKGLFFQRSFDNFSIPAKAIVYCGIALAVIGFSAASPSPFIYFQF